MIQKKLYDLLYDSKKAVWSERAVILIIICASTLSHCIRSIGGAGTPHLGGKILCTWSKPDVLTAVRCLDSELISIL